MAHAALGVVLAGAVFARPHTWPRRLLLGIGVATTVLVPAVWVGLPWSPWPARSSVVLGFYLGYFLSLAIPFGLAAMVAILQGRRRSPPRYLGRVWLPLAAYLVGLLVSYPVSYNYALLYPLIR